MRKNRVGGEVKQPLATLLSYLFIIVTIIQCNSVFYREGNLGKVQLVWLILLLIIFLRSLFRMRLKRTDITRLLAFEIAFLIIVIAMLTISYLVMQLSKEVIILYLIAPLMLVTVLYDYISSGNVDHLFIIYKNIVLVLAIISLIFWLASMVGLPTNMNTAIQWGGYRQVPGYFGLHYIAQGAATLLGLNMIRNTGLFVEAPMYAYVLSVCLLILLFMNDSSNRKKKAEVLVILIAIFTTTSTTGIIVALLSIMYELIIVKNKTPIFLKVFIVIAGILIAGIFIRILLVRKIQVEGVGSSNVRWNDIQSGYYAWKNHLWVGNGFGNYDVIRSYMSPGRLVMNGNSGFSSGLMEVLAYGGVLAAFFYVVPTFLASFRSQKTFALAAILFLLFIVTKVDDIYLYTMLLSYFWTVIIFKGTKSEE